MTDKFIGRDKSLTRRSLGRVFELMAGCALLTSGLVLAPGIPAAAADDLVAPTLQSLRLEGTEASVTFTDHNSTENVYFITMRERDNPDHVVFDGAPIPGGGVTGTERQATRTMSGIPPGVPMCATVTAGEESGSGILYRFNESPPSNTVCTDPVTVAAASDLELVTIGGREELQFAVNRSAAYLLALRNSGGTDATGVVVDISTWEMATLGDQSVVLPGWKANGFTCTTTSPTSMHCTGGSLKKGEKTDPAVIVQFTGIGFGHIRAEVSGAGDTNTGNNGTTLNVRVL